MDEKDILLLESLGYRLSANGAIIDKDGQFVPQVNYNGRIVESPASAEEYQAEVNYEKYLAEINFSPDENNPEPKENQAAIAIAKNEIQKFEKDPLYSSIPKEAEGTVYEQAFNQLQAEKKDNGEFTHDNYNTMYEEFELSAYKDIDDEQQRERLRNVDRRLSEIKAKDPDVDAAMEFASDTSKGFIMTSVGGIPQIVKVPDEDANIGEKAWFWLNDVANNVSTGIISTLSPTGTGMNDEKLQEEYKELTEERRSLMKPVAVKRLAEVDTLIEELKTKREDTDFWSTENDKYAYAITTLQNQKQDLDIFLDDTKWYDMYGHTVNLFNKVLNINNIADWASLGLYDAYAKYNYKAGLRDRVNEGTQTEADVALARAFAKEEEVLSNNFQQTFVNEVIGGTNESLKFLGFGFGGRIAGRAASREIAKVGGKAFVQNSASVGLQVALHPQTYSKINDYYAGSFDIQTNENGETEIITDDRAYYNQKKENQLLLKEIDNALLQETNGEKKLALQKQRVDLVNFDKSLKEPNTYVDGIIYGVTEMGKEVLAENYGGKLFNKIGGKKTQEMFKKSALGKELMKIPGIKGINKMSSKGKDMFNKRFGGVPGEKVIGSNTEEIFEEMLVQLTPTYGNTMEENLDQAKELLTLDFYTKVAAQTLLMQKTMALGNTPAKIRAFMNKDERAKQKELKELYKQLGSRYIKQEDFNRAMMKVGEGNFSIQEYNNEIKAMKDAGDIQGATELERTKILKQAIAAEKSGNLDKFKKAMTKAKYNKNLDPDTIMNIESLLPEIDAMLDTPYLNRSEVISLNSKKRFAEKTINDIDNTISDIDTIELNDEYDKIKEKLGVDESYYLDEFDKSPKLKEYITDNFDKLSPDMQKYLMLKAQQKSSKDSLKKLETEIKRKTSYNHQMKLEIEQQYMKYLNDMNKQLFKGKMTASQFKKFVEVKGVQKRAKGIDKKDIERIHGAVIETLEEQQSNKINNQPTSAQDTEQDVAQDTNEPSTDVTTPVKARSGNTLNVLQNVATTQAQDASTDPTLRKDSEGSIIVNDDSIDFLPASDETIGELNQWAESFKADENRNPTFKDFFDDAVEQVGKKGITKQTLETLGDAYEKAGLGKSNWEQIYKDNYVDRKSIVRSAISNAISDNQSENLSQTNKIEEKHQKLEQQADGIDPSTGQIIRLTPVKGKTNVVSTKANFKSLMYSDESITDGQTTVIDKQNTENIPVIDERGLVDIKELLHPEKNNPGTIWKTEMLSEDEWNGIPVSKGEKREFTSFQQWYDETKPENMSDEEFRKTDEFIGKVPIMYKSNSGAVVSFVPDTDWYNPYNIKDPNKESDDVQDLDNPSTSHQILINKGKENTLALRKQILNGEVSNVEIISKSGSGFDRYPDNKTVLLNKRGSTYPIVFLKGTDIVDLNGDRLNSDEIEVLNLDDLKKAARKSPSNTNKTMILTPVNITDGKRKYIAIPTFAKNENGENSAFSEDIETAKYITAAHLRLAFGEDVTALKNSSFELTVAQAKTIQNQIKEKTGIDISNFNSATELIKSMVVFNYEGKKYTMDKSLEINGKKVKASTLMLSGKGTFTQNTSLSADRKRAALSITNSNGQIKVDKISDNYEDYLKQRLSSHIVSYNLGTEENPAWTPYMQPIIKLKPIVSDVPASVQIGETGNTAKEEARQILKDDLSFSERKKQVKDNFEKELDENVTLVGSVSTGKAKENSDIDIVIQGMPNQVPKGETISPEKARENSKYVYEKLKKLQEKGIISNLKLIANGNLGVSFEFQGEEFQVVPHPNAKTKEELKKEAEQVIGSTSELSEEEKQIVEDAEQYLRDMNMIDSDEITDELLPEITTTEPIKSALKNIGNLSLAQQRDVTSYILSVISKNFDGSKSVDPSEFNNIVSEQFQADMQVKLNETLATIENLNTIQESNPSERVANVIVQLQKTADVIKTVQNNYDTFFEKAFLEGMIKGFISSSAKTSDELRIELNEDIDDEMYQKDFSASSNEVIHKDKISKKLKRLFATIPTGKKGFLGLPKHENYDVMYNTISALIVSELPTNPDFKSMMDKLREYKESFPWLNSFINEIEKSEDDVKNAFTYNMYKYAAKAKFVIFTKHNDGINSEVWNSNANNIRRKIKESWNNNFKRSNITNGSTINTKKLQSLWEQFESWGDEPWNTDDKILRTWLSDFGIRLSDKTWNDLKAGKMIVGKGKNKKNLAFEDLFFFDGNNRNNKLFSNLAIYAKDYKDKEQGTLDYIQNANLHPYKDMGSILPSLIAIEATYNSEMKSMTRRDGGKTVGEIIFPTFFFHNMAKLKKDAQTKEQDYIKTLQSIDFSSNSLTLDLLSTSENFADIFDYSEVGLQSLDEQFKKSSAFGKIDQLSPIDYMFHQRNQFQYMKTEKLDEQHSGFDLRVATMATPTNSDKGRMMLKKTAVYDLFTSDAFEKQDDGSIKFSEKLNELLYTQLIEPELKRIVNHVESNIKDYDKGATRFNLIPEINNILNVDNISTLEFLAESKDIAKFKELFFPAILSFLEKSIKSEALGNVSQMEGYIEKGVDLFNNKDYIHDTRRKDTPEVKMLMAELDFIINSMISNMDTMQIIAGDPAMFYKGATAEKIGELAASKELGVNMGKRMAMMIAPGNVLAESTDETYLQLFLADQEEVAQNVEEIIGWHYGKQSLKETYGEKSYQDLINELRNKTINDVDLKQLQLRFSKVKDFLQIETTDAQEYTTLKEHLRVLHGTGRITTEERNAILEKSNNDIPLDEVDIKLVLQPVKPVYTGDIIEHEIKNDKGEIIRPARRRIMYIKTSSFPLIPDLVNGTKLEPLMRKMNEMEQEYNTTVRASYQSGNKVGALKDAINPFDQESLNTADRLDPDTAELQNALTLDRINFKIQQDVPFKGEKEDGVSMGTQIFKLLFGDGITEIDGFEYDGKTINGRELQEEFFNVFSTMVSIQKENLLDNLGLDENYEAVEPEEAAKRLQKLLIAEAEQRGFSENDMKSLNLEKKVIDGKDVYHFKLPLWFSGNSNKFESMLNAIINNKVFKQKLPGNPFVVGSEAGLQLREGVENIKDNKILYVGGYKGGELKGNEVLAPSTIKMNGKLINLFEKNNQGQYKYLIETENQFELNPDTIDPELFDNFVFRTPTSSHGSGATIKIVGFLPAVMGDLMITPKNFITQMGQDFDIDKLTAYQFYHTVGENGRIEKLNESHKSEAIERMRKLFLSRDMENDGLGLTGLLSDNMLSAIFGEEEVQKAMEESDNEIEAILDNLENSFDLKLAKNKFIAIHNSVYGNPDAKVQAKINKVLSMDLADRQAKGIAELTSASLDESGFNILSPTYQMDKMISGSTGSSAIGIYAKGVTFNSLAQQNDSEIILLSKDEEGQPINKEITIGKIKSNGKLGLLNTLSIENANNVEKSFARKIAEAQDERVNTATDNEKAQILGRVGITNLDAVAVDNLLSLLGIDTEITQIDKSDYQEDNPFHQKAIVDGKEVYVTQYSLPYLLHSQPIVKEYFKRLSNGNAIINEYNANLEEQIREDLIGDYKSIEGMDTNFTGERLAEEVSNNNYVSDFQKEVLIKYLDLIKDAKKLKELQDVVDMSNLGKSMWESKDKIQKFKALMSNEDFQNATTLLGEFSDVNGELYLGEGLWFTPTTNQGVMVGTAISLNRNLFYNYFPYYDPYIDKVINDDIIANTDIDPNNSRKLVEMRTEVFQEMKKFITSATRNQIFLDTPSNERRNLFMDTEDNMSLSSYISTIQNTDNKEFKAGLDMIKNNSLLSFMNYEKGIDGKPSLIRFDNTEVANSSEEDYYDDFRELFIKDYPLPDKNGQPYSTQKLAQELVAYSHLSGGIIREAIEFHRFIPIEYYDSVTDPQRGVTITRLLQNYDTLVSNWDDKKRLQNFKKQFFQNNPQYAVQFPQEFRKQHVVIADNKMYVNTKMEKYPEFVTVKNKTKSKLKRDKWSLYKNISGHVYQEIDILGEFGMSEYDYDSSNLTSIVSSTPKSETEISPSVIVTPTKSAFSLSPSDTVTDILSKISNNKFEYNNNLDEIAGELLSLFSEQANKVQVKIVNDPNLPVRGRYGKGLITINMAQPKVAETFVHEFIHSISSDYINGFYQANEEGKFITDKDGNLILKSELPADIMNLNIVASEYKNAIEKKFPTEYEAFRKKYAIHKSGKPQQFTARETSLFYPTVNLKEFLAVSLSNNNDFLEETSKIPYKKSGMNILEKFAKLLNQVLSKLSGVKNSLAEKALMQSFTTLVNINTKIDDSQIVKGQELFDMDSTIKKDITEMGFEDGPTLDLLPVTYDLKSVNILNSDKAEKMFEKGKKNNWSLDKILTELQVPKEQKQIILDKNITDREEIITSLLAENSFVVEVNTAKTNEDKQVKQIGDNEEFTFDGSIYEYRNGEYLKDDDIIDLIEYETAKNDAFTNPNTQYYSNLTVPGGTNYTENEIATPDITPNIKGHAQFSTDNGIGWFRSDEQAIQSKYETKVLEDGSKQLITNDKSIGSKTRRILEVQSDLFQKGRNRHFLSKGKVKTIKDYNPNDEIIQEYVNEDDYKSNQFLQLLNKKGNWVNFFIQSIVQDSAKKGYEKILFPKGDTAAKIEGHQTLEEFKEQKEKRIKELEKELELINNNDRETKLPSGFSLRNTTLPLDEIKDNNLRETNRLKQELADVESGQTQLSSIAKFYEITITNILKKNYDIKEITDEYGNKWNEVSLDVDIINNLPNCI